MTINVRIVHKIKFPDNTNKRKFRAYVWFSTLLSDLDNFVARKLGAEVTNEITADPIVWSSAQGEQK
jgi:hypothetical protein